jgi:DNA-binding transcriptional ArsR family regulator
MRSTHTGDLSLDTALGVLGAASRRRALRCLLDGSGVVAVAELVDRLHAESDARMEPNRGTDGLSRLDRHIGLVHVHLPLLEEAGVIEFDRRSRTVVATEGASTLAPLLTAAGTFDGERSGRR